MSVAERRIPVGCRLTPERAIQSAHLVGICGSGMKPLAQALLTRGVRVSGSDMDASKGGELAALGATLHSGHSASHIDGQDVLVYSSAISPDNAELLEAQRRGILIVHRSEMLGWFLGRQESILVAGTHGKTTTTAMLTLLLQRQSWEPWGFVGGSVAQFGGNVLIGKGRHAVAEADESDGTFLNLPRDHAIITNIEPEHLNYWCDEEQMFGGFVDFAAAIPDEGHLVLCLDDPGVRRLIGALRRSVVTYSVEDPDADFHAVATNLTGSGSSFELMQRGIRRGRVTLAVPGRQNVENAIGAYAMALKLGADFKLIQDALGAFTGVDRRFTKRTAPGGHLVIDDYAHHPTEIAATMRAARMLADERGGQLIAIFQPHRYSRTACFFDDFGKALDAADTILLTDIYAAGEAPIPGIDGPTLAARMAEQIARLVMFVPDFGAIRKTIAAIIKERDIVLLLGAGSITNLSTMLATEPNP